MSILSSRVQTPRPLAGIHEDAIFSQILFVCLLACTHCFTRSSALKHCWLMHTASLNIALVELVERIVSRHPQQSGSVNCSEIAGTAADEASPAAAACLSAMLGNITTLQAKHRFQPTQQVCTRCTQALQHCYDARQLVSHDPVAIYHLQCLQAALQTLLQSVRVTSGHLAADGMAAAAAAYHHEQDLTYRSGHNYRRAASLMLQHGQGEGQAWDDLTAIALEHQSGKLQMRTRSPGAALWGLNPCLQPDNSVAPGDFLQKGGFQAASALKARPMQNMIAENARPVLQKSTAANRLPKAAAATRAGLQRKREVQLQDGDGSTSTPRSSNANHRMSVATSSPESKLPGVDDAQCKCLAGLLEAYLLSWSSPGIHRYISFTRLSHCRRVISEAPQTRSVGELHMLNEQFLCYVLTTGSCCLTALTGSAQNYTKL